MTPEQEEQINALLRAAEAAAGPDADEETVYDLFWLKLRHDPALADAYAAMRAAVASVRPEPE